MKYLRRFVWYIATRLFLFLAIAGMMVVVFYYAMNLANINVVLKDGMALRAKTVMMMDTGSDLNKYFSQNFISGDPVLLSVQQGTSPYNAYNVRGIDHRLNMDFVWIWPWDETVRVTITERIPRIDGRAKGTTAEALVAAGGNGALYPPAWTSGRYKVVLTKENGRWLIRSLTLISGVTD